MSEYTPTTDEVETAFHEFASDLEQRYPGEYEHAPEFADWQKAKDGFRRWLAEERRAAAEKAWDAAHAEIRGIPHWFDPEAGKGEFDLQPLGPNETSEAGAFMEVMRVLAENPYRAKETKA